MGGRLLTFDHHQSHAASAFFFSGFRRAAVLTVDGVGEWATTTYAVGEGTRIDVLSEVAFPHSLGLLYSTLTAYLGFAVNDGEFKVMGLAPYGRPRYVELLRQVVRSEPEGRFWLDLRYFDFIRGPRMFSESLCGLFGEPPRRPGAAITRFHQDVACSLQAILEEILLEDFLIDGTAVPSNWRDLIAAWRQTRPIHADHGEALPPALHEHLYTFA
jgi:carbamoyltransferase